ncbi:MAG: hypothetical protein C5B49_00665 [Bdellovibrio sp.]|nr:MAG: hypothetical protein C5B49_00665 [Bdellovibrio sp.]
MGGLGASALIACSLMLPASSSPAELVASSNASSNANAIEGGPLSPELQMPELVADKPVLDRSGRIWRNMEGSRFGLADQVSKICNHVLSEKCIDLAMYYIRGELNKELSNPDFAKYFRGHPEKQNEVIGKVEADARKTLGEKGFGPAGMVALVARVEKSTMDHLLPVVFAGEHIESKNREKLWIDPILSGFNRCISGVKNLAKAIDCQDRSLDGIVKNTAGAIVYESAREELNPGLASRTFNSYQVCLQQQPTFKPEDCAVLVMRNGSIAYGRERIANTRGSTPEMADQIATGYLQSCLDNAIADKEKAKAAHDERFDLRGRFRTCGNDTILMAGKDVAKASVLNDPELREVLDTNETIKRAAVETAESSFALCAKTLMASGTRKPDVDSCRTPVAKAIGEKVGTMSADDQVAKAVTGDAAEAQQVRDNIEKYKQEMKVCLMRAADEQSTRECLTGTPGGKLGFARKTVKEIGDYVGRQTLRDQLNIDRAKEVTDSEKELDRCLQDRDKDAKLCARDHAVRLARFIGNRKLDYAIKKLLGQPGLGRNDTVDAKNQFERCLREKVKPDFKMTEDLQNCTRDLTQRGVQVAQNAVREVFSRRGDSETMRDAGALIASRLPDMGQDVAKSKMDLKDLENLPDKGVLAKNADGLRSYVAWNPQAAAEQFNSVADAVKVESDLKKKAEVAERTMSSSKLVDQFIKSQAQLTASKELTSKSGRERVTDGVLRELLDRSTYNKVFNEDVMRELRPLGARAIGENLLGSPKGKGKNGKELDAELQVKIKVSEALARSPAFGEKIAVDLINKSLRSLDPFMRALASFKVPDLNFNRVRNTAAGQKAIREFEEKLILGPMVAGIQGGKISKGEMEKREERLKDLVLEALEQQTISQPASFPASRGRRSDPDFLSTIFGGGRG